MSRWSVAGLLLFLVFGGSMAAQSHLARIYVYSRWDTPARRWMPVACNGTVVAEIKTGFYFAINLDPGRYMVAVQNGVPAMIDARAEEVSFLRLDWNYGGGLGPVPRFTSVSAEEAHEEMRFLSYDDPKHVHSKLIPGADPDPPQPRLHRRDEH